MFRWLAVIITGILIVVFGLQTFFPVITQTFVLVSSDATTRPWILITAIFLHGSLQHIMGNMFGLVIFGLILEKIVGDRKFLFVFFVTGLISSIAATFLYSSVLGASGALFGVIGALTALRPKMIMYIPGLSFMPLAIGALIYLVLDLGGLFFPTNIANLAHIAGLISGIVIGIRWRKEFPFHKNKKKKDNPISEEEMKRWEDDYMKKS